MILIDPSTRQFNVPGVELTFGVESDAGSERKYFQCPRNVGNNLDLASCFVRMNFRNANGEMDSYLVDDVTVDGTNVTFSWVLSKKVTRYKGQVKFVACAIGPDQRVEWHTTLGTGIVLEGLEPDDSMIHSGTADVVAQLIAMVESQTAKVEAEGDKQIKAVQAAADAAEAAAVAEIEAKSVNVRESIPDDYTALSEAVDGLVRGKAPGIVCEAEGSTITVSDASDMAIQGMRIFGRSTQDGVPSPDAPVEIVSVEKPVVTVCGKNLLNIAAESVTKNGLTFTVNEDKSVTVDGTATTTTSFYIVGDLAVPRGSYVLTGCPTGGSGTTYDLRFGDSNRDYGEGKKFTLSEDAVMNAAIMVRGGAILSSITFYPMLQSVVFEDSAYDPFSGQTVELTHTLPGIPVTSGGNYTDSDGQQWICDEVDLERGVYVQRVYNQTILGEKIGSVDNGYISYGAYCNVSADKQVLVNNDAPVVMCDFALGVPATQRTIPEYAEVYRTYSTTGWHLVIRYPAAEGEKTIAEARKDFAGRKILFALATPIETPLSETEIAAYRALRSNYPNTTVLNDAGAHMAVAYVADTKLYIDNKIKEALQ